MGEIRLCPILLSLIVKACLCHLITCPRSFAFSLSVFLSLFFRKQNIIFVCEFVQRLFGQPYICLI